MLWIALTMVVVLLLFPQTIAGVLADVTTR